MSDKLYYGIYGQEHLDDSIEDVIDDVIEGACNTVGEGFAAIADRIKWPVKVLEYKHKTIDVQHLADSLLDFAIEHLDCDCGLSDPDGDVSDSTEAMEAAALVFAQAIVKDYTVWACEPTGNVTEVTRGMVLEMVGS